ncbi:MAG: HAD family hydrolase [Spirochaetales bacterium]|jgi:phosphoglycolate phosphatase|nr:HAD family hydrolase [Spirochaetales bacterium]
MKKAYVFDLDGTLVNSIFDISDSINYLLARRGVPGRTYEEYLTYMGFGIGYTLGRAWPGFLDLPKAEQDAMKEAYVEHNGAHCLDKTLPYDGMAETIRELAAAGALLGIYTNKPEPLGVKISRSLFAPGVFEFVLGGKEGASMKPNPERVLWELERLKLPPGETVFVGDGGVDIETGKNGGMLTCGVLWGFKGREELTGADYLIQEPRQLLAL